MKYVNEITYNYARVLQQHTKFSKSTGKANPSHCHGGMTARVYEEFSRGLAFAVPQGIMIKPIEQLDLYYLKYRL